MNTLATVQEMLIAEFELTAAQVVPESKLADLGIDSLATLEFLFKLEEKFSLDLNSDPTPVETVADIASEVDRIDYVAAVDADTLEPLEGQASHPLLLVAAHLGNTRLIDNLWLGHDARP